MFSAGRTQLIAVNSFRLICRGARTINSSQSTTGYTAEYFKDKITTQLPASHMQIVDVSCGCGAKFESTIVSEQFKGKSLIQRHRMVNLLIKDELKLIHAFSMNTLTPDQYAKDQSS
ncbi:Protein BOLA2 [Halotydeus destructor]|nr:Protein BOLA2 [Halotydeus destructor]